MNSAAPLVASLPGFLGGPVTEPPLAINLAAIAVGALAGAVWAVRKRFDMGGVLAMAVVCGLGGGLIRDTLLQQGPPLALTEPWYLGTAVIAAAVGFFFASAVARFESVMIWLDALALGLFAVVGSQMALLVKLPVVAAILVGLLTAVGGTMLRDVLSGEPPEVFLPGAPYATAALLGVLAYVAMTKFGGLAKPAAEWVTVLVVLLVRVVAVWRGWHAPTPKDLTPKRLRKEDEQRHHGWHGRQHGHRHGEGSVG